MVDLSASNNNCKTRGTTPSDTHYSIYIKQKQSSSTPIVFVHGVGLNQYVWEPQIEALSKNHTIVAYDILGHGNSPVPDESVTLSDYASQLAELLDHLDIKSAHIIGHSMGALISVSFALNYPSKVCSLIPMNIVYKRNIVQRQAVLERANKVIETNKISGLDESLKRWFTNYGDRSYKARVAKIRDWINSTDPIGYGRTYRLFALSDNEFEGKLDQLEMPVLYLTGNRDMNSTTSMSEQMAEETPNGIHAVIKYEAHMMAYINPHKVNLLIEVFITDVERGL